MDYVSSAVLIARWHPLTNNSNRVMISVRVASARLSDTHCDINHNASIIPAVVGTAHIAPTHWTMATD